MGIFEFVERFTSTKNPNFSLLLVHFSPKDSNNLPSSSKKSFFLEIKQNTEGYIVRFDKNSRIAPVEIIKNALDILMQLQNSLLTHNLNPSNVTPEHKLPFIKEIRDFLDFPSLLQSLKLKNPRQIWLEIGFGSGRHLLHNAKNYPDILHIGLEIHNPSLEQVARQIGLLKLNNLLILAYDARIFLELLPSNLLDKIFVHFPVPWEKKPHRRIFSHPFLTQSSRVLKKNGVLQLRTDSLEYFTFAKELSESFKHIFQTTAQVNAIKEVTSKYEARWLKEKKDIYDLEFYTLQSNTQSAQDFDFTFPETAFKFKSNNFQQTKIIKNNGDKDGYFLHIEDLLCGQKARLLKIAFGDFHYPETRYVLQNTQTQYFRENPLPTHRNHKAHTLLLEIIS